jgi:Flp pilus assembly protein TadD
MKLGLCFLLLVFLASAQQSGGSAQRGLVQPTEPANTLRDRGTRWALVVGISSYQYLRPEAQLQFAHRDAEQFAAFLRDAPGGALPADHIRLLTNGDATLAGLRAALHTWLVAAAGPEDVIYLFFAGHGVVAEQDQAYFVTHDSDPQNLHATALAFREVDATLSNRLRASLVVLVADVCHAGRLGWSSYSADAPNPVGQPLANIGQGDRSFLKLLATRPSERSFEDRKWNGGHGVFTYALLQGLEGGATRDSDGIIRASQLIDYVSRIVPEQTGARQHPRVAGTFDARLPLAVTTPAPPVSKLIALDVSGPAGSAIYIDSVFRGRIRSSGELRVELLQAGAHRLSADFPDGKSLEGSITLASTISRIQIAEPLTDNLSSLRGRIENGRILEADGAWDFYRSHTFAGSQRAIAAALMTGSLEDLGQACVQDYVQSSVAGPKQVMLRRAVDAYERLQELRPNDADLETRKLFCTGRLQIAQGHFADAAGSLQQALRRDPQFACAYNALGVALERLNRAADARAAFETAAKLTPEWALPPSQIASQMIARGELKQALPYLEKAVRSSPRSVSQHWNLLRLNRLLGRLPEVERLAGELADLNPNYAPTYLELGEAYSAARQYAKAAEAYDAYVLLAPNFADATDVRARADRARTLANRPAPSLRR